MELTEEKLNLIVQEIEEGTCIPFLGSAASISNNGYEGPPTGTQLAVELATECNYPEQDKKNLPRVAQFYEYKRNRNGLIYKLDSRITQYNEPSLLHMLISKISSKFKVVITTNYDRLMEIALDRFRVIWKSYVQNPKVDVPVPFLHNPKFKGTYLYKMHGTIEHPETIVITEDDYIEFLTRLDSREKGIPDYFTSKFATHTLLFLGYSLEDWNFRVLFKGTIEKLLKYYAHTSYAVQKDVPDYIEDFWSKKDVEIFDIDIYEFTKRLAKKLRIEI